MRLSTGMAFSFNPTSDYKFIYDLYVIANNFINYCCYRKNTELPKAILNSSIIADVDVYSISGEFIFLREQIPQEQGLLEQGRYIDLSNLRM